MADSSNAKSGDKPSAESMERDREHLMDAIADITERMRGPLPDGERAFMHADRKEMRERLAALDAGQSQDAETLK